MTGRPEGRESIKAKGEILAASPSAGLEDEVKEKRESKKRGDHEKHP